MKTVRRAFGAGLAALAVAATAQAQGLHIPLGRWWERPRVAQELGVTQEQQALLEEATVAHARAMVDLKATVDKAEIDLRVAADRDPLDKAKVRTAFAAMQQARTRLEAERFEMLLRVREVLTREQWEKLKVLTRERIAGEAGEEAPPLLPGRPPRGRRF